MPLELPDFSAWIECGGTKLECYAVEYSDDGKAVTCWIASEVGQQFGVFWGRDSESRRQTEDMCSQLSIDGVSCPNMTMRAERKKYDWYSLGIRTSPLAFRPYMFGSMQLTDEDTFMDTQCLANLGDIVLEIWRVTFTYGLPVVSVRKDPFGEPKIHEQAKKAVVHKVKLGEETRGGARSTSTSSVTATTWDQKLVKFTFKYRPIDVLRANDIAPRPETDLGLAPGLENGQASPGQIPEYDNAPRPINIKQENQEAVRDAAATIDIQATPVKVEPLPLQVVVTPTDVKHEDSEDEDAGAAQIRALREKLCELEKKAEIKALKKRLAELEGNGVPSNSGSQGPTKRAKREPPVVGSTGGLSRGVKRESYIIDLT